MSHSLTCSIQHTEDKDTLAMIDSRTIIEDSARALYAAHHWRDFITETANMRLSQDGYEQRAKDRWNAGAAGEINYSKYRRLSEVAYPIFRDSLLADSSTPLVAVTGVAELVKAA